MRRGKRGNGGGAREGAREGKSNQRIDPLMILVIHGDGSLKSKVSYHFIE
jgi:hypothetical protein